MSDIRFNIQAFIHELSDIPISDLLVSLPADAKTLVEWADFPSDKRALELDNRIKLLLKTAQSFRKEADINSLCIVHSVLRWTLKNQEITTPLILVPADWSVNKPQGLLMVQPVEELAEINPFVKRLLRKWTDEPLPDWENKPVSELLEGLSEFCTRNDLSVAIESRFFLGNFHYHRYHILRELEGIQRSEEQSPLLGQLLGEPTETIIPLQLPPDLLTPADADQLEVFRLFETQNVVVQGPPGTGKSQVLTNLLGKLLAREQRTLVVSEKKVALDVLVKKLTEVGLNPFAFVVHSQTKSSEFIQQLKETWLLLENAPVTETRSLRLSEQRLAQLQLLLDRLNAQDTCGGVSFQLFQELNRETPGEQAPFVSDVPSLKEWLQWKERVQYLTAHLGDLEPIKQLKPAFFTQVNGDVLIRKLLADVQALSVVLEEGTAAELRLLYQSLGRCQLVEYEAYKAYTNLLGKPREWKRFEKNRQRLSQLEEQLKIAERETAVWKTIPSSTQLESWKLADTFWAKRKRKKAIRALLADSSVDPEIALRNWEVFRQLEDEKKELSAYFRQWDLEPDQAQLEAGAHYAKALRAEETGTLSTIASWKPEKRKALLHHQRLINDVVQHLARYFDVQGTDQLVAFLEQKWVDFEKLLPHWQQLQSLPAPFYRLIHLVNNWEELQALIVHSNWLLTEARFPELAKFNGNVLKERIEQVISEENQEMIAFAKQLFERQKRRFDSYESLLRSLPQKCTAEEKALRMRLKKGKALLVKEFAKTRTHTGMRELLDSDAKWWIQALVPLWFATPTQVADHFPLTTDLFDAVIFDEASQIPLPNALGALFRSKRALIAGDDQQMSPTSFFGKQWNGHDILHQANYYFRRTMLKHHYRSVHPELIAFSNKHFYANELVVYPAPDVQQAVYRHWCKNGQFSHRRNIAEAKLVATFLETINWEQSIGVVAFSEEQLKAVWECCSTAIQERISEGQEENRVFFKSLEQVQGDEADCLLISLGYAPDEEENFFMRFGPLNHADGYKRLNVLLTRAIKEMHFFTSVQSSDFGLSANESVNLLRRFLLELENRTVAETILFPLGIVPEIIQGNCCQIRHMEHACPDARELVTFHRVMTQRTWDLKY